MPKPNLTIENLIQSARNFCEVESEIIHPELFGVTDGKAVGTYVEHKFKLLLHENYEVIIGNLASGIDLPSPDINTDIKVTSIRQPQSSCPFKDAKQKIFGLGYNLLLFVYEKTDDAVNGVANIDFVSCSFVPKDRTSDFTTTTRILEMINDGAMTEDIAGYLNDKNIPVDDVTLMKIAEEILENPPKIGYLTISNALQWRLQYGRICPNRSGKTLPLSNLDGIRNIVHKVTN